VLAVRCSRDRAACSEQEVAAQEAGNVPEHFALAVYQIAVVPAKQFVAAVARQDDCHMLASHLGDDVCRYARDVGEGLIVMPDDFLYDLADGRGNDELVMLGIEVA